MKSVLFQGTLEMDVEGPIYVATASWLQWRLFTGVEVGGLREGRKKWDAFVRNTPKYDGPIEYAVQKCCVDHKISITDLFYNSHNQTILIKRTKHALSTLSQTNKNDLLLFSCPQFPPTTIPRPYRVTRLVSGTISHEEKKKWVWFGGKREYTLHEPNIVRGMRLASASQLTEAKGFTAVSSGKVLAERVEDDGRVANIDREQSLTLQDARVRFTGQKKVKDKGYECIHLITQQQGDIPIPDHLGDRKGKFY